MAQSLQTLRNNAITPLHGRRLGLDRDETIVGAKAVKQAIEDLTTATTGTDVTPYGVARYTASGSSQGPAQHHLAAPIPGVQKFLALVTTSTGSCQFLTTPNGAAVHTASDGTSASVINLVGPGGGVTLMGLTTAIWAVVGQAGVSSASNPVTFTTST